MPAPTHPPQQQLEAYATGELASDSAALLKTHLIACEACRAVVRAAEENEGRRLVEQPGEPLAADALQRVLDQIDGQSESSAPDEVPEA
ncbi:zf-HC2 domain-containing protein [Phenylobacterium sp.]|uniref:zf-HC2 domain-containing protein n=1 Tax=Phenylobacterium sp. TaxID=1871053 RepID=UPI00345764C4